MSTIKEQLLSYGTIKTFRTKQIQQDLFQKFQWPLTFPWHEEQQQLRQHYFETSPPCKEVAVQGIFGNGKTTLMMGIFVQGILEKRWKASETLFCAFNLGIRNELRQTLKGYHFKMKPQCVTFDALIYAMCKAHHCPHLDVPNFEGRRRFVECLLRSPSFHPERDIPPSFRSVQQVFVDEAQDLDYRSHHFFRTCFVNARFFFMGDLFQCIQKDPRESLLALYLKIL
jgi:hypothetical protein